MKIKVRLLLTVLFLVGFLFAIILVRNSKKHQEVRLSIPQEQEASENVPNAVKQMEVGASATNESIVTTSRSVNAGQTILQKSAVPMAITFTPGPLNVQSPVLLPLISTVSNAVLAVDRILKTRDYQVNEYSRSIWLTSEDKTQSIVWTIFPSQTNAVVGAIEASAYQDESLTQKDPSRSFQMQFDSESGVLLRFSWADKHEVLVVQTNNWNVDYARHLDGKKRLVMRWDTQGNVVSSNIYDWAVRGRIIDTNANSGDGLHKALPSMARPVGSLD